MLQKIEKRAAADLPSTLFTFFLFCCVAVYFNVENNLISNLQPPPVRSVYFSLGPFVCRAASGFFVNWGCLWCGFCESALQNTHTQSWGMQTCALKSITRTPTARLFAVIIILTKKLKETHTTPRETLRAWVMRPWRTSIRFKYSSNRLPARADMETSHQVYEFWAHLFWV